MDSFDFGKPGFGYPQNVVASSSSRLSRLSDSKSSKEPVPFRDIKIPGNGDREAFLASIARKKNSWAIIVVKGYENPFPETEETKKALLDHLSSCGKIRRFEFADDPFNRLTERCALIEVWGKEGVAKAVELSGSDIGGGQKIAVRPALTFKERAERAAANKPFRANSFAQSFGIQVELSGSDIGGGQKIAVRPALTFKERAERAAANKPFRANSFAQSFGIQ